MTTLTSGKQRREKLFGEGRSIPLDRNAKIRVMALARALMRRTDKGKHYGVITAKFVAVLQAMLWGFHNQHSGRCYPSYDSIADRAGCARSTVYEAIRALELAGLLTWCNRLVRVREVGPDLFGRAANRWRIIRTSNAYRFNDPRPAMAPCNRNPSKFDLQTETAGQVLLSLPPLQSGLAEALERLGAAVTGREGSTE